MAHRLPPSRQPVTIGHQIAQIQKDFPRFWYSRSNNVPTWVGPLQPRASSPVYTVRVIYRFAGRRSKQPRVWVESPEISTVAPHRYCDGSLCLHFPRDGDWAPSKYISKTIIPWTALWLAFYEIWLDTDHWYGPEAPHISAKRRGI
jgi:hypothetical protein